VFSNVHYVFTKYTSDTLSLQSLRKLKTIVKVLPVDEKVIELDTSLEKELRGLIDEEKEKLR